LSSILKALQKLESESAKVDREKSWLKRGDSCAAYAEGPQKAWTSGWRAALLGTLIILAGGAGVVFSSKLFRQGRSGSIEMSNQVSPSIITKGLSPPKLVPERVPEKITNNSQAKVAVGSIKQEQTVKMPYPQGQLSEKFIRSEKLQKPKLPEKAIRTRETIIADPDQTDKKRHGSPGSRFKEEAPSASSTLGEAGKTKNDLKSIASTPEPGAGEPGRIGVEKAIVSPGSEAIVSPITPENEKEPPSPSEGREIVSIKVLEGAEINLQAISWAPDADRRIAVINNRIVKEGDRVSGFLVFKINRDDVILSEGGELWKLNFGHR
jgi:hypothetical protein